MVSKYLIRLMLTVLNMLLVWPTIVVGNVNCYWILLPSNYDGEFHEKKIISFHFLLNVGPEKMFKGECQIFKHFALR